MTKQRTYNRRRLHLLRKKDNWSEPRAILSIDGDYVGFYKLLLQQFQPKHWIDDQLAALRKPIEFVTDVTWKV
jgi:hypothetical protein